MPSGGIADPARIRRVRRAEVYARVIDIDVLTARPDAQDGFGAIRESFYTNADDAQVMLEEVAALIMVSRRHEAAESSEPLRIGTDIPIVPRVPSVKMIDPNSRLDNLMLMTGIAVDHETQRNSVEALG